MHADVRNSVCDVITQNKGAAFANCVYPLEGQAEPGLPHQHLFNSRKRALIVVRRLHIMGGRPYLPSLTKNPPFVFENSIVGYILTET